MHLGAALLLLLPALGATAQSISGTVFEDVNYGGGAGRDRTTALANGGSGRPNVRVELYQATGVFLSATTTDTDGAYSFSGVSAADYYVRVVNSTVSSARSGYAATLVPVQTFRTDHSNAPGSPATDHVGGEVPNKIDAGSGSTNLASLTTGSATPQSITMVAVSATDMTEVDFGFNFDVVCNVNDAGQGSMRQFITNANALSNVGLAVQGRTAAQEHAVFMISNGTASPGLRASNNYFTSGVASIVLSTSLPEITFAVDLDATTQPGFASSPLVELNGAATGSSGIGLEFNSAADVCVIRGFVINRFPRTGIHVNTGSNQHRIEGNYIGTDATGTLDRGNGTGICPQCDGIRILGSGTVIGGTTAAQRNIISGNDDEGVSLEGNNNAVFGNYIGTNAAGTGAIPNGHATIVNESGGLLIQSGSFNVVGGAAAGQRNVISGNIGKGIFIQSTPSTDNRVQANYIGLNAAGTAALANTTHGIAVDVTGTQYIGGFAGEGNVISGNTQNGIQVMAVSALDISNNIIGLNPGGTAAIPNVRNGILFTGGSTATSIRDNVISGNTLAGILSEPTSGTVTNVTITGNTIGLNPAGNASLPNGGYGIRLAPNSSAFTIGGTAAGLRNVISGNAVHGVQIEGSIVTVQGNYIGLSASGTTAFPNQTGLSCLNAQQITVEDNALSGNSNGGVIINGGDGVALTNNRIGTNDLGTASVANGGVGVTVLSAANVTIGTDINAPNVISGNGSHAISLGSGTTLPQIVGNIIGLNKAGTAAVPNGGHGIQVRSGVGSGRIGGAGTSMNVISGNVLAGIFMQGPAGQDIRGNRIGTNLAGTAAIGNTQNGIHLSNAMSGVTIGGLLAGEGNLISGNGMNGFYSTPATGTITNVTFLGNTIGLNATGTTSLPNASNGIHMGLGCNTFTIGGTAAGSPT